MIVRGFVGLLLGIGYGLFVGAVLFVVFWLTTDGPGPMIPDNYGWGQILIIHASLIAGVCGALVGLIVGVSGVGKVRGLIIGSVIGLLVMIYYCSRASLTGLVELSWVHWPELLMIIGFLLLLLPIGLGLTGIVVSITAGRLKTWKQT